MLGALALLPVASRVRASVPPRVASLSWAGAQILASIGAPPMALTELDSYPKVGALPPMPSNVIELGSHSEPNLELLAQLAPDLIVIDQDQSNLEAQLQRIAPTFVIDIYDSRRGKPFARAVEETGRLAARLDRVAQARAYLDDVDRQLDARAATVATLDAPPVLVVDLYDDGRRFFVYGPNSMIHDVMTRLNIANAWRGDTDSGWVLLNVEDLASMGHAQMFYISHGARDRIALSNLSRSPLWRSLPFASQGRFHPLPGFFTYGAASCATQCADGLTQGLVAATRRGSRANG
ncbi:Fe3 -hydroxamate ABC transporter periplasmic component [Caballeronia novacaledonica]|uniref:Fe3 -hydroxamate ABC transporter periplasmic component n=1 Tax=Caballeronia novacaledonica TaxID=1544861 RepID=A0A2U3IDQ7_9BURK|nr:ABC transporter substrate-binding protein [Caballeronia novacaledonica]SPB18270.1 Fe3 -hydroxamate ABC transporter periplasmic component [Caballeronia novacaledonica]